MSVMACVNSILAPFAEK